MLKKDAIYLSVVIPSYNEMPNLQKGVLDKVEHFLNRKNVSYEVLIVDDGSTDGSADFVDVYTRENPSFKLIKNNHMGKAGAVTTGMLVAKGEYILFTDMDQATPIEEVDKLLPYLEKGFSAIGGPASGWDIVIGSRNNQRKGAPWTRIAMARAAILLRKIIVGLPTISDTQCGFKAFGADVAKKLFARVKQVNNGFSQIKGSAVTAGFDVELLFLAQKMGYKIKEVPVEWLYVETRRVSPVKDSIDGLLSFINIKLNDMKGKYK